jgi:hypothetical protein
VLVSPPTFSESSTCSTTPSCSSCSPSGRDEELRAIDPRIDMGNNHHMAKMIMAASRSSRHRRCRFCLKPHPTCCRQVVSDAACAQPFDHTRPVDNSAGGILRRLPDSLCMGHEATTKHGSIPAAGWAPILAHPACAYCLFPLRNLAGLGGPPGDHLPALSRIGSPSSGSDQRLRVQGLPVTALASLDAPWS